jgi:arginyl-tRNA synthetase
MHSPAIVSAIAAHVPLSEDDVRDALQLPPDPEMGDVGFPCFPLAKLMRKAPNAIAAELADAISPPDGVVRVAAFGPYLNFFIDRAATTAALIGRILAAPDDFGRSDEGDGKTVVVEYSSPNIAKHLGVHHLRGIDIGGALCRIFAALGYDVVSMNFLGDWGTGFGKLIAAYERYGLADPAALTVTDLQDLYIQFSADAEADPQLEQDARDAFLRLEQGEPAARAVWQACKDVSLAEFREVYETLGVAFDVFDGESAYAEQLNATIAEAVAAGVTVESDGALIVPLEDEGLPPLMLRKSDGASLYPTRDLCAAIERQRLHNFHRSLYVVGNEQSLHFQQLKATLGRLDCDWADRVEHIAFGLMKFRNAETGQVHKGSTRKGQILLLKELLAEAVERAGEKISQSADRLDPDADLDALARQIGIGAVIFSDLSTRRNRDVTFEWDSALSFEGNTGPYVQYAHARLSSILRKAPDDASGPVDYSLLTMPQEWSLVRKLETWPATVSRAGADCEPSLIATWLLEFCAEFSTYYSAGMRDEALRVLCPDPQVRAARLQIVRAARHVIRSGLALLGLAAPDRM